MAEACLKGREGVATVLLANLLTQFVGAVEHKAKASQVLQL